jgi:uncharacterized protein YyaL (SSP411 family)
MDESQSSSQAASVEQVSIEEYTSEGRTNGLAKAASAYLRSAMRQPVDWMEWGEAAFDRAIKEDKPILLDIGAVWCHWCHVMDRESYEDATTAQIINEQFIAVKVDRDERPDVDSRYQAAVSAISGQGGWPLTAFLTPEGKPYFGGTYFPPEDRHGRPSFQRVLLTMAEAFENRRAEVDESAGGVMDAIEHNESFSGRAGNPGPELVEKMVLAALKSVDLRHGGFGAQPKFPHSSAVDLLIDVASRGVSTTLKLNGQGTMTVSDAAREAVLQTLDKMAKGGIYDHLAGGFHRYSVDEHWVVPHFEKMAYDNSELLRNYVHAFQTFGEEEFARVARDIMRWMDEWLSDREHGGFYASQDADFSLDDDGDYFTWTRDEAAEVLTPEELAIAAGYYDIGEIGDMQHNVAKNVLHVKRGLDVVARKAGVSLDEAHALLDAAKRKMYAARKQRPTPYVDKTIYVAWDAMCISAYLEAARVLGMPEARAFALKSLDRVLGLAWDGTAKDGRSGLAHVVAYGEPGVVGEHIAGVLDDYVFLGHAALDAWAATGELRYYEAAVELMESALRRFYDPVGGAFFDTESVAEGERRLGALAARRKPLQDSPTPAGNPVAAMLLMRLSDLNGRMDYAVKAQETLEAFAGIVEHFGLYASTYALALQRMVHEPVQVCVIGDDAEARSLEASALKPYAVNKSVLGFAQVKAGSLPPVLDKTLPRLPKVEGSFAVLCSGHTCQPPVTSQEELAALLARNL